MTAIALGETAGRATHLLWEGWEQPGFFASLSQQVQAVVCHALALGWRIQCEPLSRLGASFSKAADRRVPDGAGGLRRCAM